MLSSQSTHGNALEAKESTENSKVIELDELYFKA
jgi:hypothetical protein